MQANEHYASHVVVFGLQVLGESLELNPHHDQEMHGLEYCTTYLPQHVEMQLEMRTCMLEILLRLLLLQHSVIGSSYMATT